jgi:hypothetical protein
MSLYSAPHFDIVAVVRSEEGGTHQKENNVCCLKVRIDLIFPLLASANPTVMPARDVPLALEERQMRLKGIA